MTTAKDHNLAEDEIHSRELVTGGGLKVYGAGVVVVVVVGGAAVGARPMQVCWHSCSDTKLFSLPWQPE